MRNLISSKGIVRTSVLCSTLVISGYSIEAESTNTSLQPVNTSDKSRTVSTHADVAEPEMVVTAPVLKKEAGSKTVVSAEEMQKKGTNDFGSVMRYEPLISAIGASGGSSAGKSGFDRSGYTGYNIRGLESNRVGLDVDGIPQPEATGRSYAGRVGVNTFGIGRDYIDPYMYGQVDIESGATSTAWANNAIGGSVSFMPKSADDYLSPNKLTYFGDQSDYDSANRSWHNGITIAAGDETLRGVFVYSRRDGQQTRNNSGTLAAYPANWYSNAMLASGIWRPNDQHKLTGTVDYYDKTNHTHFDSWNSAGSAIWGTAQQQSNTRRWGFSLKDEWTPVNAFADSLTSRVYYQQTQAHDNTWMPSSATAMQRVYSNYDVDTYGFETQLTKSLRRHDLSGGLNASTSDTTRPFRQSPAPSQFTVIMQPQADSRSYMLGGYLQDQIHFDLDGHDFSIVPGVRIAHQTTKPQNLYSLTTGSAVLTESQLQTLYGKANADTQVLPSLSFNYDLTPQLMTYVMYKRGTQFPGASQLFGSWNLGSSYAGSQQYALIGNSDLKTETSKNVEWGLKGQAVEGVTLNAAMFYNTYENFIAYTRYTRAVHPGMFSNVPSNIYTIFQAENRDKAYIYGGQVSTKVNFGTWFEQVDGLSTTFALGYTQGKSKSSYAGDQYVDLDSVAPMKAIVGVAWDDPAKRYGTAVTATFVKGKRAMETNREAYTNSGSVLTEASGEFMRVPGYGLLDMTAYWQVAKNVRVNGGIYNLTDRKYWDYLSSRNLTESTLQDAYDKALAVMPGRTFLLGMNIDF
ncbi:TonB-dependent receptor [Erwinia tracheiphila]|uniref:TonB-dependent receptor n=1 Tax=Erwinia tracheiphila TaxID=65700 RepID=A0A345CY98_9GAMM|nr:TonB-dependent receptor [Erwinia tracheiphila]AXF78415.1 TonB-dependent receptor [Erwinia tracheiphila]UIA82854.1 TonB-dependent receptor [Erwinia tracheiphila]UIA91441.1 TonB-dependent receptor [Erwinia tracheiphila]